ncbi:MAG TPA: hypothetical protein VH374_26625 [Polyangia bacterium]|nr:hypothetical protein [Polyangia bacterium]
MNQGRHRSDNDDTLLLTPQSRELLRQVLKTEKLDGEPELIGAVKEALRLQYSRGFHEGVAEGAKGGGPGLPAVPPPRDDGRGLSPSVHNTESSQERRQRRRQRRFRQRLRNALVTVTMLVMAGAVLLALNSAKPELSAERPNARHRTDSYR